MDGVSFADEIGKVADLMSIGIDEFLEEFPEHTDEDCYATIRDILYDFYSYDKRKEYERFLISMGCKEQAKYYIKYRKDDD